MGDGLGIIARLKIGDRELRPSKFDDVGSIGVLVILGGVIGGYIDYTSKAF